MLAALVLAAVLAGCAQAPDLMPDMQPVSRPMLTPDEQRKAIQAMAERKAAVDALVTSSLAPQKR
jgi:hypothetical protein